VGKQRGRTWKLGGADCSGGDGARGRPLNQGRGGLDRGVGCGDGGVESGDTGIEGVEETNRLRVFEEDTPCVSGRGDAAVDETNDSRTPS